MSAAQGVSQEPAEKDKYPEWWATWDPASPKTLKGRISAFRVFDDSPVIDVEQENGEHRSILCRSYVLRTRFAELKPEIGELVEVENLGKTKTRDGSRSYWSFDIKMPERPAEQFNWDRFSDSPTPAPETDVPVEEPEPVSSSTSADDDELPF